jgi:hypothetical protein
MCGIYHAVELFPVNNVRCSALTFPTASELTPRNCASLCVHKSTEIPVVAIYKTLLSVHTERLCILYGSCSKQRLFT